jgi:hypothetical protein
MHILKCFAALCLLTILAACGGAGQSQIGDMSGTESALSDNTVAAQDLNSYEADSGSTGLPGIPLESGDDSRAASDWDPSLTTVFGSDFILQQGSQVEGTSLLIGAGAGSVETEEGNFSYGMYQVKCEPGTRPLSLNIECTPESLSKPYFVAVANYTDLRWKWFGPVNLPEFQLELAGLNKQFSTNLGNLYFLILSPDGSVATHSQTTLICGIPSGNELPGCPHHLVASDGQVPDGVALNWLAGNDNTSFQIFRLNPEPDNDWIMIGQTQQTQFLDTHAPDWKMFFYRVSAVNPNGESCFSNVDSGFAGGGEEPGIITGRITNMLGEPIAGIPVALLGFDEQMLRITNQEGKFLYRDLAPAHYVVVPLGEDLKFFPPARMADLTTRVQVDMHFNAAPEALFHRVHGFVLALTPPDAPGPPVLPLAGVPVTLNPIGDPDNYISTVTDECGHYAFNDIPNGIYMVRAHLPGMEFIPNVHEVVINGFNPPDRRDFFGHPSGNEPPQP